MTPTKILVSVLFVLSSHLMAADLKDIKTKGSKALQSEGSKALKKFDAPSKMKALEKKVRSGEVDTAKDEDNFKLGLGLQLGSGATYGNGLVTNFDLFRFFRLQIGGGYNSTGPKAGGGVGAIIPLGRAFGLQTGASYAHSFGVKDQVSLDARFTPEGGSQMESVEAIRKFRISPGNYYSLYAGGYFALLQEVWIDAHVIYNKIVSGHQIEFYDTVTFDQPIDATNEESLQVQFDKKAREKLDVNGLGFSIGIQYRI